MKICYKKIALRRSPICINTIVHPGVPWAVLSSNYTLVTSIELYRSVICGQLLVDLN